MGTLRPPAGVSGLQRDAIHNDKPVLVDWVEHFFVETFSHQRDDAEGERFVDNADAVGDRFVLWDDGGTPVSMAMLRAPSAGVSRIGPVFTPRDARGHGYGSAVTASASDLARRGGVDDVVLFADLANPTSNAIYQRIGFEPVSDSVRIDFVAPRWRRRSSVREMPVSTSRHCNRTVAVLGRGSPAAAYRSSRGEDEDPHLKWCRQPILETARRKHRQGPGPLDRPGKAPPPNSTRRPTTSTTSSCERPPSCCTSRTSPSRKTSRSSWRSRGKPPSGRPDCVRSTSSCSARCA